MSFQTAGDSGLIRAAAELMELQLRNQDRSLKQIAEESRREKEQPPLRLP